MAHCLHVTLRVRLKALAPGLTPRAVLDKMTEVQMLDVHFPTTDDRTLILSRYTEPTREHKVLLQQLNLMLPPHPHRGSPPPAPSHAPANPSCSGDLLGPGCDFAHFSGGTASSWESGVSRRGCGDGLRYRSGEALAAPVKDDNAVALVRLD
jgi:hypothetical protein